MGAVAFITLLERKFLGLSQVRLGPNKVTLSGLLQPVADGVKLLAKQFLKRGLSQSILFLLSPLILFRVFIRMWRVVLLWEGGNLRTKLSSLLFFSLLGRRTYVVILTGWAIISTFAKLGRLRGILQRLSYEVALILVFMIALLFIRGLSLNLRISLRLELLLIWSAVWLLLSIMETNRAPFDLLEGERELIRGFNIEMGRLMFVFLFLREYGIIIIMARIISVITYAGVAYSAFVIRRVILVARRCYPRVRYDSLMSLIWQALLPIRLLFFYLVIL